MVQRDKQLPMEHLRNQCVLLWRDMFPFALGNQFIGSSHPLHIDTLILHIVVFIVCNAAEKCDISHRLEVLNIW